MSESASESTSESTSESASDQDLLTYPTEQVVGVLRDPSALDDLRAALRRAGVDDGDVEVLHGQRDAHRLDPDGEEHGVVATAMRRVQKALGDEAVRLERLNAALEAGHLVVQVGLGAEDDDAREREKQQIGDVLAGAGADHVAFYGRWQIEELQIGA